MALLRFVCIALLLPAVSFAEPDSAEAKRTEKINTLRKAIVKARAGGEQDSEAAAKAYKELFTYLGRDGLKELTTDDDTSIALQAAWETYKKTVKRDPEIGGRADWVFDQKLMKEFLAFYAKRVKAEPPEWWRKTLVQGDVFPGEHHAFIDLDKDLPTAPKVEEKDDEVTITTGKQVVKISKAAYKKALSFPEITTDPVALWGPDLSFIALPTFRGYPFEVVGVDAKTGKKLWTASVWASRRGFSSGPLGESPVEVRREGDTVIVYGCESHGMYAEGFDAKTGKCQFRFCTSYWFNHSESWGLK